MTEPMSAERLAEIRRNLEPEDGLGDDLAREAVELLSEVDRLREFNSMLLGIEKKIIRAPRYNERGQRIMQDGPQA